MIATTKIEMTDLSRQKRLATELGEELTPAHTVEHAVQLFLERLRIAENGLRWTAFSRGVRLDLKRKLSELPEEDTRWTVMPEVSAGAR